MDMNPGAGGKLRHLIHGTLEKVDVVVVEWGSNPLERGVIINS